MTRTQIDAAHAAMEQAPQDDAARLRFWERLAEAELFLLLAAEPEGEDISPELFEVEDQRFVLVFDRPDRLTAFTGRASPYAAMSGRALAQMLAGQGIGLALNPDVAPSAMLVGPEALDWLRGTLDQGPSEDEDRITELSPPGDLPEAVLTGLDRKLALAGGRAALAYLVQASYGSGARGHLLAFVDPAPGAEAALARAVGEALTFSGVEAGTIDVTFTAASDPFAARLARVGLRFDLPEPEAPRAPGAPGMDPDKPPRLR